MYGLGPRELVILAFVLVLLFGSKKIPEITRGIGEAIRHIRSGFSDEKKGDKTNKNS